MIQCLPINARPEIKRMDVAREEALSGGSTAASGCESRRDLGAVEPGQSSRSLGCYASG